jgi:DNA primase
VHYPDFLDEKQDRILRLKFPPELDQFCSALFRLLIVEKDISVQIIYDRLEDVFYKVLQDIHGKQEGDQPWGYKLFRRFKTLRLNPPPDFVSRCIDHLARRIHLDELDEDIQRARNLAGEDDSAFDRLLSLVRERQNEHADIEGEGTVLAEWASDIRRLWGPAIDRDQSAAMQRDGMS